MSLTVRQFLCLCQQTVRGKALCFEALPSVCSSVRPAFQKTPTDDDDRQPTPASKTILAH